MRIELTDKLLEQIQSEVFGPCTVVYEALTIEELRTDALDYMDAQRVFLEGEDKPIYVPPMNLTNFKSWLLLRKEVEMMDAYPEHPFDMSDGQIMKMIEGRRKLNERLTANINKLIDELRS